MYGINYLLNYCLQFCFEMPDAPRGGAQPPPANAAAAARGCYDYY